MLLNEDDFHIRAFKTEEEAKAYIQGIDDATGWLDSCVLDEYEIKILNNILKEKQKISLTNAKFGI
ncbi:MAG: hypothetical protein LIP09_00450 [Bacteroidales bacterium]|nr:hypothetical protein [Bacteroidales bacterium]